jgi:hypothetical protein
MYIYTYTSYTYIYTYTYMYIYIYIYIRYKRFNLEDFMFNSVVFIIFLEDGIFKQF